MKFHEFSLDQLDELPQIHRNDVRLLWHAEYYDGPLNGLLNYQGCKCWFQVVDEPRDPDITRRFVIIEILPEELYEEERWHDLFREKVGTHTDYDENEKRHIGALHPKEMHHEFYDAYKNHRARDFSNNRIIGWFQEN